MSAGIDSVGSLSSFCYIKHACACRCQTTDGSTVPESVAGTFAESRLQDAAKHRTDSRGCSSIGRAFDWQSKGRGFESPQLHQLLDTKGGPKAAFLLPSRRDLQTDCLEPGGESCPQTRPTQPWYGSFTNVLASPIRPRLSQISSPMISATDRRSQSLTPGRVDGPQALHAAGCLYRCLLRAGSNQR